MLNFARLQVRGIGLLEWEVGGAGDCAVSDFLK